MKVGASFHAPSPICFVPAAAPARNTIPGLLHIIETAVITA